MGLSENVLVEPATVLDSHNAIWGARSSRDVLIKREIVKETFKPLRIVSSDYEFRQKVMLIGLYNELLLILLYFLIFFAFNIYYLD